jgi:hypothetical protein
MLYRILKLFYIFLKFKLNSPSGIMQKLSALHAIRGFRMLPCIWSKGSLITFCNFSKGDQRPFLYTVLYSP